MINMKKKMKRNVQNVPEKSRSANNSWQLSGYSNLT